jgi:hypothetical protein
VRLALAGIEGPPVSQDHVLLTQQERFVCDAGLVRRPGRVYDL